MISWKQRSLYFSLHTQVENLYTRLESVWRRISDFTRFATVKCSPPLTSRNWSLFLNSTTTAVDPGFEMLREIMCYLLFIIRIIPIIALFSFHPSLSLSSHAMGCNAMWYNATLSLVRKLSWRWHPSPFSTFELRHASRDEKEQWHICEILGWC